MASEMFAARPSAAVMLPAPASGAFGLSIRITAASPAALAARTRNSRGVSGAAVRTENATSEKEVPARNCVHDAPALVVRNTPAGPTAQHWSGLVGWTA